MKNHMKIAGALLAATSLPAVAATPFAAKVAAAPAAAMTAPTNFSVYLPLRNTDALDKLLVDQQTAGSASYHKWLTPSQFNAQFGPTTASIARVKAALAKAGLNVTAVQGRAVQVAGTVGQVNKLFSTSLHAITNSAGGPAHLAAGKLIIPAALKSEGAKVIAFSALPPKHPMATPDTARRLSPDNAISAKGSYYYNDLKQAYDYPSVQSYDGTGAKVAILMSGALTPGDVNYYFNNTYITVRPQQYTAVSGKPAPSYSTVPIDGGGVVNNPDGGDFEAALDVQQVLGGAPGSQVTLVSLPDLYDNHIIDGYNYIVNSTAYDVVNSSFGECELYYTPAYNGGSTYYQTVLAEYDPIFKQGNAEGITFVASSGDSGGLECENVAGTQYIPGVSTPASSSYVTGVGGTNLVTAYTPGSFDSTYVSENDYDDPENTTPAGGVWGAGGGISTLEAKPSYQSLVNTGSTGFRTIPDVGMQVGGCPGSAKKPCGTPRSSVITAYEGGLYSVIGTSVSSPEFVSAIALYIQKTGQRQGNLNPYLYHFGATQTKVGGLNAPAVAAYFHRNIPGNDGVYADTVPSDNYNYIVGNGTPDVRKLFGFTASPAAGIPQTASNP